jgi:hypothetical protein
VNDSSEDEEESETETSRSDGAHESSHDADEPPGLAIDESPLETQFDPLKPEDSLKALVSQFEICPRSIAEIPEQFVKYYGLPVLANSLNIPYPPTPHFDGERVAERIGKGFNTVQSLIAELRSFQNEIDRLYGIFYYTVKNIAFDPEFSGNESPDFQETFQTKKGTAAVFANFMEGISKEVGFKSIEIYQFPCFAKTKRYSYLQYISPQKPPNCNRLSVIIKINGEKWLCEPAKAATLLMKGKGDFGSYFLRPLARCLNDHFPVDKKGKELIGFDYDYEDFKNAPQYLGYDIDLRSESFPLSKFECTNGILEMQFSCSKTDDVRIEVFTCNGSSGMWQGLPPVTP